MSSSEDIKSALRDAIAASWAIVGAELENYRETCLVWTKEATGRWSGKHYETPHLHRIIKARRKELDEAADEFTRLFIARYPNYTGPIGLHNLTQDRIRLYITGIPESAVRWIWYTKGLWCAVQGSDMDIPIEPLVADFVESVEQPFVRLRFQGQLLNFRMDTDTLAFPDNLTVRRLNEREVSALDGGSLATLGFMRSRSRFGGPHEFVVEGEIAVDKEDRRLETLVTKTAREKFNKLILCLRTFKSGHVGYDYIRIRPVTFCQFSMGDRGYGDLYVPFGGYYISNDEANQLAAYAEAFFPASEPAMAMACSRLADAETRTRPQDRLVDAVIGMEAILLAGSRKRRNIKRRFSERYAALCDSHEDRRVKDEVGKSLYELRSDIAHGCTLPAQLMLGQKKVPFDEAARRATEALREIIHRFLPETPATPYKNAAFWCGLMNKVPGAAIPPGSPLAPDKFKEPILISACLLGIPCRWHGRRPKKRQQLLQRLQQRFVLVPICPEQLGGMPTPRTGEMLHGRGAQVLDEGLRIIAPETGEDVTRFHVDGARYALEIAEIIGARRAYLKGGSPSCDREGVTGEVLTRGGLKVIRVG